MKFKYLFVFLLFITTCFSLSGCKTEIVKELSKEDWPTLKVEMFSTNYTNKGYAPTNKSYLTKWIQTNFGDPNHINLEFVAVERAFETDAINKAIATSSGPDIMFSYNPYSFGNYVKNNYLHDLTFFVDEYGKNIKEFLTDEVLEYGRIDKRQFAIPAKRMLKGKFASYIRKDWLDKLGLPIPTTTTEFFSTLMRFKNDLDVENIIPLTSKSGNSPVIQNILMSYKKDPSKHTISFLDSEYKEGVMFLNKMYNNGLITNSYAVDKNGTTAYEDIISGRVGFFTELLGIDFRDTVEKYELLKSNISNAELAVCDPFTNFEGKPSKEIYNSNGMYIFVPSYSDKAELAIKYLNWMSQPEIINILQYGVEGEHYYFENKNINLEKWNSDLFNSFDIAIIINGYYAENEENSLLKEAETFAKYKDLYKEANKTSIYGGIQKKVNLGRKKELKYADSLNALTDDLLVRCIISNPSDFDRVYELSTTEYLNAGGRELQEEINYYNNN